MNFKIDGELVMAEQLQEIFLSKRDLFVKFNDVHEFKAKIHATQVCMDRYGKIFFSVETGELTPSGAEKNECNRLKKRKFK